MLRPTQTDTYVQFVSVLDGQLAEVHTSLADLARTKNGKWTASQKKQLNALKNKRKTLRGKRIQASTLLSLPHVTKLKILAECQGQLWTDDERNLNLLPLSKGEGWGEKPLKLKYGLSTRASTKGRDLGIFGEVKHLVSLGGVVQGIQCGGEARELYLSFLMDWAEFGLFQLISKGERAAFRRGEVSQKKLASMNPVVSQLVRDTFKASIVLLKYGTIHGTAEFGYIKVPIEDSNKAWRLRGISKGLPRYVLNESYVDELLAKLELSVS